MMNCIVVDDEAMSRQIMEGLIEQTDFLDLKASCSDAIEATNVLNNESIDLIFLDIEMPEISGIEFVKNLQQQPQIIFTTSHKEYALEAFEYNVTDYLLKPFTKARFFKSVTKAHEIFKNNQPDDATRFFVKKDGTHLKIELSEVIYMEALGDFIQLILQTEKFIIRSTMKDLETKLPGKQFLRIHRSYIVNIDKISAIEDTTLVMGKKMIPIGKSYRSTIMDKFRTF
jgi:DNA-binding LytR/AlgR family response regulator